MCVSNFMVKKLQMPIIYFYLWYGHLDSVSPCFCKNFYITPSGMSRQQLSWHHYSLISPGSKTRCWFAVHNQLSVNSLHVRLLWKSKCSASFEKKQALIYLSPHNKPFCNETFYFYNYWTMISKQFLSFKESNMRSATSAVFSCSLIKLQPVIQLTVSFTDLFL